MIQCLYDCFKHWCKSGSVYILSDTHFEDYDCKLMDKNWIAPQEQVDLINKIVYPSDTFVCLGDCGNPKWFNQIRANLKVLITGNHDVGSTTYKKYFDEIYKGPVFISDKILLSHEPIDLKFCLNIHGHDHTGTKVYSRNGCEHINVAANVCDYEPINLGKIIKEGALSKIDSIHRITIDNAGDKRYE